MTLLFFYFRSANPLGKLMDFLQEDVDSMQRELEQWRSDNKQLQLQLRYTFTWVIYYQNCYRKNIFLSRKTATRNSQHLQFCMSKCNFSNVHL